MQTLDVGEIADLSSDWYDADGAAEPSAITLEITKPDGTLLSFDKTDMDGSMSDGSTVLDVWTYAQVVDIAGPWRYTFSGTVTGAPVTQMEQVFLVGIEYSVGPCEPWCTWEEVTECVTSGLLDGLDPAAREMTIDVASEIVYNLDRRKYSGICTTTRALCLSCRRCAPLRCGCEPNDAIDLALVPVWGVWDVIVDGVTLAPSEYEVTQRRYLSRTDGSAWPRGDDWFATWAYGRPVPPGGRRAVALFAAEIAKGCLAMECQIPQRVTSIVREGVSYPVLDSLSMIQEGRTGVALTDLWIVSDLKGSKVKPGIFSPGAHATAVHHR